MRHEDFSGGATRQYRLRTTAPRAAALRDEDLARRAARHGALTTAPGAATLRDEHLPARARGEERAGSGRRRAGPALAAETAERIRHDDVSLAAAGEAKRGLRAFAGESPTTGRNDEIVFVAARGQHRRRRCFCVDHAGRREHREPGRRDREREHQRASAPGPATRGHLRGACRDGGERIRGHEGVYAGGGGGLPWW